MKSKLLSFFFKSPSNWKFWLFMALAFKGILFFCRIIQGSDDTWVIHGFWGYVAPDSRSYLWPIEDLIKSGTYGDAIRMPGYGAIYWFFRLFSSQAMACNFLILWQYILASVSVYYLAMLAKNVTNNNYFFHSVFYLFLISSFSNCMDQALMTESLCTSFLIFTTYFFFEYFQSKKTYYLILSGAILSWVIFLRPVFLLMLLLYAGFLIFQVYRLKLPILKALLFFLSPFIFIDGLWIVRNYPIYHKAVPLTGKMFEAPEYRQSAVQFIQAWGGNYVEGDTRSLLFWFGYHNEYCKGFTGEEIPDNIYTSQFNRDSLLNLKKLFISIQDSGALYSANTNDLKCKLLISKFNKYTLSIKEERKFLYYIKAPLLYLKDIFILHWASYNVIGYSSYHVGLLNYYNNLNYIVTKLFHKINPINWLYMLFNYIIIALGIVGIFLFLKDSLKNSFLLIFIILPLYTILIHTIVLRQMDSRYLMPAWPFLIICASYCLYKTRNLPFQSTKIK